jgi:hypothetical protein
LAVPLVDAYLEFVAGHCAANTVPATAFDLKVFIGFVGKPPGEVTGADALIKLEWPSLPSLRRALGRRRHRGRLSRGPSSRRCSP